MNTNLAVQESSQELSLGNDQLLYIADQAEKRVAAINTIMKAALKMTTHLDWVNIGGTPYLQETGASKIGRLLGVSWQIDPPYKINDTDNSGHYSYRANGRFFFAGAEIDAYGLRTTHDDFFIGSAGTPEHPKVQKKPQDVDERDVMQAAYTNCLNNGIKRIVPGLRNITFDYLKEGGIDTDKIRGYSFNTGAPAEMSGEAKDQKGEIERMLKEMCGNKWTQGLQKLTAFTGKDGAEVAGKSDINKLTEKQVPFTLKKVKTEYDKWIKEHGDGRKDDTGAATSGDTGEDTRLPV